MMMLGEPSMLALSGRRQVRAKIKTATDARLPATEGTAAECLQLTIHAGIGEAETEGPLAVLEHTCKRG